MKFNANALQRILKSLPKTDARVTDEGRKFLKAMEQVARGPHVAVGITQEKFDLEKQVGPGEPAPAYSLGEIAVVHEFGSKDGRIPERSYLRVPAQDRRREMIAYIDELRKLVVGGKMSVRMALGRVGVKFESMIRERIRSNIPPKLKDATVRRKTRDGKTGEVALVDWGQLLQAISSQVVMNGHH